MTLSVDFMSDLHVDMYKGETFDYARHKKNNIAIVAGDVTSDAAHTVEELKKIAAVYETVLFIDGNHESKRAIRKDRNFNLQDTEDELRLGIAGIPNVAYMKDSVFIKDGVAIIGRNGHWDYRMSAELTREQAIAKHAQNMHTDVQTLTGAFARQADQDFEDLRDLVITLNKNPDVHTIVVVTHTVPRAEVLSMWPGMTPEALTHYKESASVMGNTRMGELKAHDPQGKLKYWLFGHQHDAKQAAIDGVQYVAHPRGLGNKHYAPLPMNIEPVPPSAQNTPKAPHPSAPRP